ncbi:glutamate ABC transporter substrate-binding protein [Antrihabitans cavernicola]|uniref:Glutamate ABC transporter substrate-binding protein n=2 Tax=Antrihabitans cavernicola TaxID=2495913 RepID=A0A5A7SAP2_9NOCA|nr:glutamate ABC transporter substrate-binding protein [Spelaeibacter cavernicola]
MSKPATVARAVVALATAFLAVACTTGSTGIEAADPASISYTDPPLPARAVQSIPTATTSTTPAPDCGDPTMSLRPFPASDQPARGPSIDAIRARGRLIVGLDTGSNLFSFRDPLTGAVQGFDVEIAKEIARDLLGDPEKVDYRILGSADRESALQAHTVDIVAKTMTINCQRRQKVTFSTVYYQANQRILVLDNSGITDIADLAGKRVCIVDGTTSLQHIEQFQPAASITTVPSWADCLVVLQQGQVDAVSTDDSILAGLAAQDPYTRVVGGSISPEPYGIGISKGSDDLVRFVNGTLDRIRNDGTWNRIYDHWLTVLGPSPGPPQPRYQD